MAKQTRTIRYIGSKRPGVVYVDHETDREWSFVHDEPTEVPADVADRLLDGTGRFEAVRPSKAAPANQTREDDH